MPDPQDLKRHIVFSGRTQPLSYTSPQFGGSPLTVAERNRSKHGNAIKELLETIQQQHAQDQTATLPSGIIREDGVYVEFTSEFNFQLAFESFEDGRSGNYHLLRCVREGDQYRVLVWLSSRGISAFIRKVDAYLTRDTESGNPRNQKLFNNIQQIQLATLQGFWNEPTLMFPENDEETWWEVWLRREDSSTDANEDDKVVTQLQAVNASISDKRLLFPEHIVRLVKATPQQLAQSLMLLDNLAELRLPKDAADFFTELPLIQQQAWTDDLLARLDVTTGDNAVAICILDTGVNNGHPLLQPILPDRNLDSFNPSWGNGDGERFGHGTQMAGLAGYGDLQKHLSARDRIQIFHQLESVKMLNRNNHHEKHLYGQVTVECVSRAVVLGPSRNRILCMAITAEDTRDSGRPSSWSASVDKIIFGESGTSADKSLFFVSGGNVVHDNPGEYPAKNAVESIHDPGQAFNAITVGGYTEKSQIDQTRFPDSTPLAPRGGMAPSNSTSVTWRKWPIKPDIVFEAGNLGVQRNTIIDPDSLLSLTTANDFRTHHFVGFGDTSGATAIASNFAAQIYHQYPELWPESVRGIMIHSASWTQEMLGRSSLDRLTATQKTNLLRSYGFGVPDLFKALNSLNNSLTLIAQRQIQPFAREGSAAVKTNEMHMFDLPWPRTELLALGETDVKLTATLSYFIEPNPGSRFLSSKFSYQSHGLRFKIKRPLESEGDFRVRINRAVRNEEQEYESSSDSDSWLLGERVRNIGSIQKDIWIGTGAALASMNQIAVHPVNGWWRFRTKLLRYEQQVRYSLILTIETPNINVDLYTPVQNLITVQV